MRNEDEMQNDGYFWLIQAPKCFAGNLHQFSNHNLQDLNSCAVGNNSWDASQRIFLRFLLSVMVDLFVFSPPEEVGPNLFSHPKPAILALINLSYYVNLYHLF